MKRILAIFLSVLCIAALLGAAISYASNQPSSNVVYEYALLGDVYTPEAGLLSATAPNGKTIATDGQPIVLDWAQGSYIFAYENKTVNLKVYECAPEDTLTVSSQVPNAASQGMKTKFPGFAAHSSIRRTDGAPAIKPYAVSAAFWFEGKQIQVVREVSEDFYFVPTQSGLWMVSYQYTDVFGRLRTQDYPFTVTSDRIIVSDVEEIYFVGNTIGTGNAYGFYNGKQYPVTMELQLPDGTAVPVGERYILSQEGTYQLSATVQIEGETVTSSSTFQVYSGLQSFITDKEGFDNGVVQDNYDYIEALSNSQQGLLLDMTAATASFRYNGVVDLNKLGKETPIVSFTTNHSYGGNISRVVVTLTDVYDTSNSVSVTFNRNSDMSATAVSYDNTFVQASFGNTSVAVGNYYPMPNSSVGWATTFNSYWRSPEYENEGKTYPASDLSHAMNLSFDMATNTVNSYGYFYLVDWDGKTKPAGYPTEWGSRWYPIADLDSDSLLEKFKGFTTGEVYVKLTVAVGRGDIMLHSIGGVSMANLQDGYKTNTGILLGEFDGTMPAAVGVEYALPSGSGEYVENLKKTVTLGDIQMEASSSGFVPDKVGDYTVTYEGTNQFGNTISKTIPFKSIEKPELAVSYETIPVKVGEIYTIGTPIISGYGKLSYAMTLNGEEVVPGQNVRVQEEMVISVAAKDALDTVEQTFTLQVNKDAVDYRIDFPRAAVCGSSFTFPEAEIYDYLSGEILNYEIYVNGVKQEQTMTLPAEPGAVSVEYRTSRGSQQYTLLVRKEGAQSGADVLLLPTGATAQTNEVGTMVTVSASAPVVSLPYKLSATSLPFQFIVLQEQLNFNTMTLRLTDGMGTSVTASVVGLQEDEPHLYVNGQDTLVKLSKQALSFASGIYEGKVYYVYTMEYHDMHRAMMNASKIEATVATDTNGILFQGFSGGVYLDIYPEEIQGSQAVYGITQISNQYFYASSFEYGDIVPPALHTPDFFIGNNNVKSGYVLRLANLRAYDVLQANASLTVTLTLADGTVYCQNAEPAAVENVVLEETGVYLLKIESADAAGTVLNVTYRFTIEDEQGPKLTLSGSVAQTAKAGDKLVLPSATATDDTVCRLRVAVYAPNGKITIYRGTENQIAQNVFEGLIQGSYQVRYIAVDEKGNVTTQAYTVTVEG